MLKIICALLIIAGTYLLSKSVFINETKRMVHLKYQNLPFYLKGIITLFALRKRYKDGSLWDVSSLINYYPAPDCFPWFLKFEIMGPFIGFILIVVGTLLSLLI